MERFIKVSVIVPVYNCESYLSQCLQSLAGQTLRELEVLLVDDGSTDGSGLILDQFVQRDPRFRIIRQKNQGCSAARNEGLRAARGTYVGFMDADDYVEPDFYAAMLRAAEERRCPLVTCDYRHTYRDMETGAILGLHDRRVDFCRSTPEQIYLNHLAGNPVVWNKLYHASLLQDPPLRFEGASLEDMLFLLRLIPRLNGICTLSVPLYHYRQRRSSTMNSGTAHISSALFACSRLQSELSTGSLLPYLAFSHAITGLLFSDRYRGQPAVFYRSQLEAAFSHPFTHAFSAHLRRGSLDALVGSGSLSKRFYRTLIRLFRLAERDTAKAARLMWLITRMIQIRRRRIQGAPFS